MVSPTLTPALAVLVDQQSVEWRCKTYSREDLTGAFLVFAATDSTEVQLAVHADAQEAGLLINVADAPQWCDFQVPAVVRRGDLTLGVATGGKSPAVAAMVRQRLERVFGEEYGLLTSLAALLRDRILAEEGDSEQIRVLFQQILHDDMVDWLRDRQWDKVRQHLEQVFGRPVDFDPEILTKENS